MHLLQTTSFLIPYFSMIEPNVSVHVSFLLPFNVLRFLQLVSLLHTTQLNNFGMVNSLDSRQTSRKLIPISSHIYKSIAYLLKEKH